eukprot:jgi/Ulvmu1/2647/UM014_0099.1
MSLDRAHVAWESPAGATRQRSHEIRLETMTDASYVMNNAVALAQHQAMHGATPEQEDSLADLIMANTTPRDSVTMDVGSDSEGDTVDHQPQTHDDAEQSITRSPSYLQSKIQQIDRLQTDIAGMEAIISAVQGYYEKRSVTGRRLPKLVSQAELRKRASELTKLRHQHCINPAVPSRATSTKKEVGLPQFAMFFKDGPLYKLPISDDKSFCGRDDARLVIKHLDKVLPAGALAAKYRLAVSSTQETVDLYLHVLKVRDDFKVVDTSLRECARIVAANCLDRAQAINKVRQRYTEVFNVLMYAMCMEYRALVQSKRKTDTMEESWEDMERQLRVARATATMEHRIREQQAAQAEEESERRQQAAVRLQEELANAKAENSALAETLEAEVRAVQHKMRSREEAMNTAHRELQHELETVKDESEELQRKLRVAERQLARFRKQQEPEIGLSKVVKATQTDCEETAPSIPTQQPDQSVPADV